MFHLIIFAVLQTSITAQYFQPQQQQQQQHYRPQYEPQFQSNQQPQQRKSNANSNFIPIRTFDSYDKDGTRNFGFQTADGQKRVESMGADGTVRGSYSYMGPDGKEVKINYVADKNGFHASGPTIPKPPPAVAAAAPQPQHKSPDQGFQGRQNDDYNDNGRDYDDGGGGGRNFEQFSPFQGRERDGFSTQNFHQRAPIYDGAENNEQRQSRGEFDDYGDGRGQLDGQYDSQQPRFSGENRNSGFGGTAQFFKGF